MILIKNSTNQRYKVLKTWSCADGYLYFFLQNIRTGELLQVSDVENTFKGAPENVTDAYY